MATYKVIQDIEAEDKLIGPLSFRQFVYFLIAAFLGYLNFIALAKGASFLLVIFAPPMLFCLFFAWPWSPDQPTEIWAVARIRFLIKPRKRIWDQSGIKEFVTVTAPKKIERVYTDGLSQTEVRSRLHALAHTIDSRGWAIKNAYAAAPVRILPESETDRLVDFSAMPRDVPTDNISAADDILDEVNNPAAYHLNELIDASTKARRQSLLDRMNTDQSTVVGQGLPANPNWFTPQAQNYANPVDTPPTILATEEPIPQKRAVNDHLKTVQPLGPQTMPTPPSATSAVAAPQPVASQPNPAILNLAHNDNLDVATLAREAKKSRGLDDGEVVISLH